MFGTHLEGSPVVDYGTDIDWDDEVVPSTTNATHRLRLEIHEETAHVKREPPPAGGGVVGTANDKPVGTGSKPTEDTLASPDTNECEKQPVALKDIGEYVDLEMGALTSHEAACKWPPRRVVGQRPVVAPRTAIFRLAEVPVDKSLPAPEVQ